MGILEIKHVSSSCENYVLELTKKAAGAEITWLNQVFLSINLSHNLNQFDFLIK